MNRWKCKRLLRLGRTLTPLLVGTLLISLCTLLLPAAYQLHSQHAPFIQHAATAVEASAAGVTDASATVPHWSFVGELVADISSSPSPPAVDRFIDASTASSLGKVTVILTGYEIGIRFGWLQSSIKRYLSAAFDVLVDRVILVWNNPNVSCPMDIDHPKFVLLPQSVNSLNNRWMSTLPHIRTAAVFNLDDDVFVSLSGMRCMQQWWNVNPQRFVAPYVRLIHHNDSYVMDDLRLGGPYSIALPRAIMLSLYHLEIYANSSTQQMLRYVDEQTARCDDILLNAVVGRWTSTAPLRVLLPTGSVLDHFANCDFGSVAGVGGLTMQPNRSKLRSDCTVAIAGFFERRDSGLYRSSDAVATCTEEGQRATIRHEIEDGEFAAMLNSAPCHRTSPTVKR